MAAKGHRLSAAVVLHRPGPEVFLVARDPNLRFFPGYHTFPGGTLDRDEAAAVEREGLGAFARAAARELEEEVGVRVPAESLVPCGRLVTPPFAPVRYDTQFYAVRLPDDQDARIVDTRELTGGAWTTPADALARWARGEVLIPPPTVAFLRRLAGASSVEDAAASLVAEDGLPHHERFLIEMHPDVIAIPQRAPTLPPADTVVTYFVAADADLVVVDPGTPFDDERVVLAHHVDRLLGNGERKPRAVLLTHHHSDHWGSAQFLKERYGFPVLAHAATARELPPGLVDREVADGDALDLGTHAPSGRAWRLEIVHTPGHAPGHVAVRDSRFGAMLVGDLVSGVSTILVDPEEGDMRAYMESLQRVVDLDPPVVLPGHGPPLPGSRAVAQALAHRRDREARVRAALAESPGSTPEGLVPVAYADTPNAHPGLAAAQVLSILAMLAREGAARREGERWWPDDRRPTTDDRR